MVTTEFIAHADIEDGSKNGNLFYATADDIFSVFFLFFLFFSVRHKNTRQPFSGMAERIFMKLLPNNSAENVVSNVVPKWRLGLQ